MINQYRIRSSLLFIFFCVIYAIIIFNLYLIQIKNSEFFIQLGVNQYHITVNQIPERAPILDRTGKNFLALNKDCMSAFILPNKLSNQKDTITFLKNYFPQAYEQWEHNKNKHFMYVKRKLSPDQYAAILNANIDDIKLLHESNRFYPLSSTASIIGLTNIDNSGIMGIELICNKELAGVPTTLNLYKDARSGYFHFKKETTDTGFQGNSVSLTIDGTLQFLVEQHLKKTMEDFGSAEGAVIIMDPSNGEILTMVSYPHFDPNNTQNLDLNLAKNTIITEAYELGSVIKIFAALAALEQKMVTPDELINCKNSKTAYVDGRKINTWKANGIIPFSEVIAQSNNIGTAIVTKRVGTYLYDHYVRIGFGRKTGILFPGENQGFVNPPHNWSKQSIISLSYGYEISATLLQLACAFSMIANDGNTVIPTLFLHNKATAKQSQKIYSDESITTIKNILQSAVEHGTTYKTAINGYTIMSKTGTANLLINGQYDPTQNIFTCAGIVQKDTYKRVIVTFIKQSNRKNIYAATVAAPLFRSVAQTMIIHERII